MILKMSKELERKMAKARSYAEWKEAAIAYDKHSRLKKWKETDKSRLYDYKFIRRRLDKLEIMRRANDNHGLLFTLNEGIHGNLGGMGRPALYKRTKFGTKQLIVDYAEEVSSALTHLAKPNIKGVSLKEKVDFFRRAQICYGSSALLMSGAGTYLFFHLGVLKALWEQDLIPNVLSGSSGGALIAAVVGTRPYDDLGEIFDVDFVSDDTGLSKMVSKLTAIRKSSLRQNDLERIIEKLIPDLTFAEAFKVSGLHINVSIAPAERHQKSRLLNAITSPNVMVREAVLASCCIPGMFPPVTLAAKDVNDKRVPYLPSRKWVDGSLSDDLPMKRLSRLYAVNHFIVSQTNPIVLPFLSAEKGQESVLSTLSETGLKTAKDWALAASHLMQKPLHPNSYFSKLINGYISVVSQTYTGDINILPSNRFLSPAKALAGRSQEEINDLINEGERSTWPNLEKIRIQTHISRTLSQIVNELDQKMLSRSTRSSKNKDLKLVKKKA